MKSFTYVTALSLLACLSNAEVSGIHYYYMDDYCNQSFNMGKDAIETGRLELTSNSSYQKMTCTLTIVAPSGNKRIMFYFENLDIEGIQPCSIDSLELFDGEKISGKSLSGKLCGNSKPGGVYTTTSHALTLQFTSKLNSHHKGFDAVFTAYHSGACNSNEYDCSNGRCIADDLTCNGYNPCGDFSDCHLSGGAIAGIVIGCAAFIGLLTVVFILLRRRRRNVAYTNVNSTPAKYGAAD